MATVQLAANMPQVRITPTLFGTFKLQYENVRMEFGSEKEAKIHEDRILFKNFRDNLGALLENINPYRFNYRIGSQNNKRRAYWRKWNEDFKRIDFLSHYELEKCIGALLAVRPLFEQNIKSFHTAEIATQYDVVQAYYDKYLEKYHDLNNDYLSQ